MVGILFIFNGKFMCAGSSSPFTFSLVTCVVVLKSLSGFIIRLVVDVGLQVDGTRVSGFRRCRFGSARLRSSGRFPMDKGLDMRWPLQISIVNSVEIISWHVYTTEERGRRSILWFIFFVLKVDS